MKRVIWNGAAGECQPADLSFEIGPKTGKPSDEGGKNLGQKGRKRNGGELISPFFSGSRNTSPKKYQFSENFISDTTSTCS